MKKYLLLGFVVFLFASCDKMESVDNYYIADTIVGGQPDNPENPDELVKKVLIVDFTGVKCVNCPKGHRKIHELSGIYPNRVVAVAIHAGFMSEPGGIFKTNLQTSEGNAIYSKFGNPSLPIGLVDSYNKESLASVTAWDDKVSSAMSTKGSLAIDITKSLSEKNLSVKVDLSSTEVALSGLKTCVWITEDNITTNQADEEAAEGYVEGYTQMHVFRDALSSVEGDDVKVGDDGKSRMEYSATLDDTWKIDDLNIVVFVFDPNNGNEVIAANELKFK